MREVYAGVTQVARQHLYRFMKDNQISPLNNNVRLLAQHYQQFITSNDYPDMLDNIFRQGLGQANPNRKTWAEFDFGKTVGYAWRKDKLTKKQAQSRARNILLLEMR